MQKSKTDRDLTYSCGYMQLGTTGNCFRLAVDSFQKLDKARESGSRLPV
jgi:hypothetical protein